MAEDGIEVRVVGFEQLREGSLKLATRIEHDVGVELDRDSAAAVAHVVRARVPHLSGALAGSVTSGSDKPGTAFVGIGDAGVPYAGWIEFGGTRGRPYAPIGRYLMPSALAAEPQIVATATRQTQKTIGGFPWPRVSP